MAEENAPNQPSSAPPLLDPYIHPRKGLATFIAVSVVTFQVFRGWPWRTDLAPLLGAIVGLYALYRVTKFAALVCLAPSRYPNKMVLLAGAIASLVAAMLVWSGSQRYAQYREEQRHSAAQAATIWTPYAPPDGSFVIDMPGAPGAVRKSTSSTPQGEVTTLRVDITNADIRYSVAWVDYRVTSIPDPASVLENVRDGFAKDVGGTLLYDKEVLVGRVPGREIFLKRLPNGVSTRARLYLDGVRLYELITVIPDSVSGTAYDPITRFLTSFQPAGY